LLQLLTLVLSAAPAGFTAAAPGLTVVGIDASRAGFYTEHVAQELASSGIRVVTQKEIAALLGAERQRQLLGCGDQSSCVAELAAALGSDGVLIGDVAKLEGGGYQVTLKMTWTRDGRPLTSFTGRAYSEDALLEALSIGARKMASDLAAPDWPKLAAASTTHRWEQSHPLKVLAWVPLVLGVALAGAGTAGMLRGSAIASQLGTQTFESRAQAAPLANEGRTFETLGVIGIAAGAAAFVAGVVMYVVGGLRLQASAVLLPGYGGAALAVVLP